MIVRPFTRCCTITPRRISIRQLTSKFYDNDKYCGLKTPYGWFAIPRNLYARQWTESSIQTLISQTYGDSVDSVPSKDIQKIIDDWASSTTLKQKPPAEKYVDVEAAKVEHKINEDIKELRNEKVRARYSKNKITDMAQFKKDKQIVFKHIFETGEIPPNFDPLMINLYNARNHFCNKFHNQPGFSLKQWADVDTTEREKLRIDFIDLLKQGQMYKKGKLVPLKGNFHASSMKLKAKSKAEKGSMETME
ncbi:hypothetical protein CLIB1444_01S19086 [[Candida] jaroonii]|uniref:Uncharacterized protein n=1 Tax=[Candida] jaroonii TaxID=467808 RepID=A0ACA9Y231_9ASCO|nr:hypothetical protein CLIB1444_01S19086 [[Candida] jaroonii]